MVAVGAVGVAPAAEPAAVQAMAAAESAGAAAEAAAEAGAMALVALEEPAAFWSVRVAAAALVANRGLVTASGMAAAAPRSSRQYLL